MLNIVTLTNHVTFILGDEDKGQMELLLREAIKQAIQDGNLTTKDWLKEPVPQLFVN